MLTTAHLVPGREVTTAFLSVWMENQLVFFQLCSASVCNKDVSSLNRSESLEREECWGQSALHPLP